jgi:hypothetical protein
MKNTIMTQAKASKILGYDTSKLNQIKIRFDLGKYTLSNAKDIKYDRDCIIWYEHRHDRHGKYVVLYTVQGFKPSQTAKGL